MGSHYRHNSNTILTPHTSPKYLVDCFRNTKPKRLHLRRLESSLQTLLILKYFVLLDFFLSTELIPRRRLKKWINRSGFRTRKLLILKWIFLGNILTMGYKTTLLSTLIPVRYENAIDSLKDLKQSRLPLVIIKSSAHHHAFANDPRSIMKQIYKKSIIMVWTGPKTTQKAFKM